MSAYQVDRRDEHGEPVYTLSEKSSGSRVDVIPGIGAQCARFVWVHNGTPYDILRAPESIAALREDPIRYGLPLLFPFPNRIAQATFEFEGRRVDLPVTEPERGNAIHGLVLDQRWSVADYGADDDSAFILLSLDWQDRPDVQVFPFPFELRYRIALTSGGLQTEFQAKNTGPAVLPMGFGVHPWFPVPLIPGGERAICRIQAPVSHLWELENLVPTGRIVSPEPGRDLREGVALGDLSFDDVYTNVCDSGVWEAIYTDPAAGIEIAVQSDPNLREFVVYTAPDQPIVCLEPYSCATDAFNLEAKGIVAGMIRLEPGANWHTRVAIVPRPIVSL